MASDEAVSIWFRSTPRAYQLRANTGTGEVRFGAVRTFSSTVIESHNCTRWNVRPTP